MPVNTQQYKEIAAQFKSNSIQLIAVSKLQSVSDIEEMYNLGHRDFGENYVQELVDKYEKLPKDIRWHFIGHLQRNKVKYIAPFVHLIQGVDSFNLLKEINKEAHKSSRIINCLLQVHIAEEETKYGLNEQELHEILMAMIETPLLLSHVQIKGLMGMASFTENMQKVKKEMTHLQQIYLKYKSEFDFTILSMGMSGDYNVAINCGSNMVRIGSLLFGARKVK